MQIPQLAISFLQINQPLGEIFPFLFFSPRDFKANYLCPCLDGWKQQQQETTLSDNKFTHFLESLP